MTAHATLKMNSKIQSAVGLDDENEAASLNVAMAMRPVTIKTAKEEMRRDWEGVRRCQLPEASSRAQCNCWHGNAPRGTAEFRLRIIGTRRNHSRGDTRTSHR